MIRKGLEEKGAIEWDPGGCPVFGEVSSRDGRWGGILSKRKCVGKKRKKKVQGESRNNRPWSDQKGGTYNKSAGVEKLGCFLPKSWSVSLHFAIGERSTHCLTSLSPSTPSPFMIKSRSNQIKGPSAVLA